jgi:hypothetical protein
MTRKSLPFFVLLIIPARLSAAPPPERIAPANTVELTIAPDLATLETHWSRTQFARIYADPAMKAFFNGAGMELFGLFELPDAIGIKWATLKQISGGPIASISIPLSGQQPGTVIAIDISNHRSEALRALSAVVGNAEKATVTEFTRVWNFKDGANNRPMGIRIHGSRAQGEMLFIADPPEALGPVLDVWNESKPSLADSAAFKSVRARTAMQPGETADLFWYFDPFGWDASTRPPPPTGKKKRAKDFGEVLRQEGFDGVKAIGGSVAFGAGECDALARIAVYAPQPHRGALQMLAFRAGADPIAAARLPGELAACMTCRLDAMTAFESFAGIFDEIAGDGEKGTFKEVIDDLRDNPKGPRVDLRKEMVSQLGDFVTLVSDCQLPLCPTSERAVAVFTLKDEKVVADAIRRAVEDDPKVKKTTANGRMIWELVSDPPVAKKNEPPPPPDPNVAFCVADGKLYIANQASLIERLFATKTPAPPLNLRADYQRVCKQFERLGGESACVRLFARPEEDLRLTYDMWRKGQLDQATSIYAYGLNAVLPKNPAANTVWTLDGHKLPEYERVSKEVGPAGVLFFVHPDGWDGTAFLLSR